MRAWMVSTMCKWCRLDGSYNHFPCEHLRIRIGFYMVKLPNNGCFIRAMPLWGTWNISNNCFCFFSISKSNQVTLTKQFQWFSLMLEVAVFNPSARKSWGKGTFVTECLSWTCCRSHQRCSPRRLGACVFAVLAFGRRRRSARLTG